MIDFSAPILSNGFRFFMAKPKQSVHWTTFFDVFHVDFWLVVLLVSFGLAAILCIETSFQNESDNTFTPNDFLGDIAIKCDMLERSFFGFKILI